MTNEKTNKATFEDLVQVMARLRSDTGCPWDRKQTMATIKDYFLEEVYEAIEAIESGNTEAIKEELGDVLFEVCFLARIAEEQNMFDVYDSIASIVEKLINRHPHVFGDERVEGAEDVPARWMALKAKEKRGKDNHESILDGIPSSLPSLLQALRISERAVAVGFEWDTVLDVLEKVDEELQELRDAIANQEPQERLEDELGDLLFTIVNVGRKLSISPHDSLKRTMSKFRRRFGWIETQLAENDENLEEAGIGRLEELWQQAKRVEAATKKAGPKPR